MKLTYADLNNCIEAMRTVVGTDKAGASSITLLSKPSIGELQFVGISSNYQVIKTIRPEFDDADVDAEIIVNFKKFSELVALSKTASGIDTDIFVCIDTERKEIQYTIIKREAAISNYSEAQQNRRVLSRIKQTLDFVFVADDKRHGGLDAVNIEWLMQLENDSAENVDTAVWEVNNFINTMTKMIAGDAGQVIMSKQLNVVATCNSNYAVYKEDKSAALSLVFQSSILSKILSIVRMLKSGSKEEKVVVLHKYDNRLAIFDEEHSFVIQTDIPLARKSMLNHINGFNSADYSHAGAVIRKDIMLDVIKCFDTLTDSQQANLKFLNKDGERHIRFEVPNSTSRQNDMSLSIKDMLGDTDVDNKAFGITLGTLIQMLNTCDSKEICLSIALPEELDSNMVPASTETAQSLIKIASLQENNTEGIKCYSILG